jgi:hypothetical protein
MTLHSIFSERVAKLPHREAVPISSFLNVEDKDDFIDGRFFLGIAKTLKEEYDFLVDEHSCRLFHDKNSDYGPSNLAQGGLVGVVVRLSDKFNRLINLEGVKGKYESLEDNVQDAFNYCIIASMFCDKLWIDQARFRDNQLMLHDVIKWQVNARR